ncbi:hypothetical protein DDF67_11395 [Caulobacter endophyticus]|uniref:Uncharacterized protein n=1 Tax=Caulobacter endophyticus TaxID=2172652 RepID=A0A2T9K1Q7_9CAUL|nr:hypothetical protein DDF67_11395 [Caulobacter endophyticus]
MRSVLPHASNPFPLSRSATAPPSGGAFDWRGAGQDPPPLGEVARRAGGGPFSAAATSESHHPLPHRSLRDATGLRLPPNHPTSSPQASPEPP